jgi:hypothetical protein
MAKLQIFEQDEQQARLAFAQEHGRFLPSSLCPELKVLCAYLRIALRWKHDDSHVSMDTPAM